MKYALFFVSLYLASCSVGKLNNEEYRTMRERNSLYLISKSSNTKVKVAEGDLAIDFFKKNVKSSDRTVISNIYSYYLNNNLDSANSIFYIEHEVGGKNWMW